MFAMAVDVPLKLKSKTLAMDQFARIVTDSLTMKSNAPIVAMIPVLILTK
jgi:hypothetical protein